MPTGFAALYAAFERVRSLTSPAAYEATADEQGAAALAKLQDMYGVYQEGDPSLADSTVLERARLGFPPDEPLLLTGGLRDANQYSVTQTADGVRIDIGIPAGDPHAVIAEVQEHGDLSGHVPPRPRYRLLGQEMGPNVAAAFGDVVGAHITG